MPVVSRRIEHSSSYPFPVAEVHAALTGEQYWRDRLAEVGGDGAALDAITPTASGGVTVTMTQAIPEDHLPSIVTKIRPGDLIITRTETWGPLVGGRATGTFAAEVEGAPAQISGNQTLAGENGTSTIDVNGAAEVKIPLVGGKIESAIADEILRLLDREQEFTGAWLAR